MGEQVRARVSYDDGHGSGKSAASDPTGVVPDRAPTITAVSADPPRVEENQQEVGAYTAADPDGHTITWLVLTGTDHEAFELTGMATDATRVLQFKDTALPNFEVKSRYTVTLQVSSQPEGGGVVQTAQLPVPVDITNAEDEGTVALSSLQPVVGVPLTPTLSDEDGTIRDAQWESYPPNSPPVVTGDKTPSVDENTTAVSTYKATDADADDTLEWQALAEGRANGTPMELVCFVQGYLL